MLLLPFLEKPAYVVAQFMNRELRSIEDMVRYRPYRRKKFALGGNCFKYRLVRIDGMRASGLAEPADERGSRMLRETTATFRDLCSS